MCCLVGSGGSQDVFVTSWLRWLVCIIVCMIRDSGCMTSVYYRIFNLREHVWYNACWQMFNDVVMFVITYIAKSRQYDTSSLKSSRVSFASVFSRDESMSRRWNAR